jgi:two-component system phosphate regulon response regulator PhoB
MTTREHSSHSVADSDSDSDSELTGCVLLVDDNDPLRHLLALALQTAGFQVVQAATQLELQRRLADTRPDALVIDLQRSEADGLRLLDRMRARQQLRDVPIVFLAASDDDEFRWQAMHAGADWFGLRPVSLIDLQTHVGRLIRHGRPLNSDDFLRRPPAPIRRGPRPRLTPQTNWRKRIVS